MSSQVPMADGRDIPMQVLAFGMPRTGTNSMCTALEILGLPCYHGFTMIKRFSTNCDTWNSAMDWKLYNKASKPTLAFWDSLLGEYGAIADLPGIIFTQELLEAYPHAKVVLVERDVERWYQSFDDGIIKNVCSPVARFVSRIDPIFVGRLASVSSRWTDGWFHASSKAEMQAKARAKYHQHYAEVRRITPADRLLEFDLKDGWEPLCRFLDKDIPQIPFPRTNDSKELEGKIQGYMGQGVRNAVTQAIPWTLAAVTAVVVARWYGSI